MSSATQPMAPAQGENRTTRGRGSFLLFQLSGAACALPVTALREIVPMAQLSRPPGLPSLLEGFLNLGGTAVPVVRLDRLFNLQELTPGLYTPLLVLRASEDCVALIVKAVRGIVAVSSSDIRAGQGGSSFNDCVEGEATIGDEVVHLLCPERLLLEKERQCLAELQAIEQDRLRDLEDRP